MKRDCSYDATDHAGNTSIYHEEDRRVRKTKGVDHETWPDRLGRSTFVARFGVGCSDDSTSVSRPRYSERSDSSFAVGDSSVLRVGNFSGSVAITPGNLGRVEAVAEKWAERRADLADIEIDMVQLPNGVRIDTVNLSGVNSVSVDLDLTVPVDTRPTIQLGAGEIRYEGLGEGECSFSAGAGTIVLSLPANFDAEVNLAVGAGSIRVDFPVVGIVGDHVVDGIIVNGTGGRIVVQVGSGNIIVKTQ